MLDYDTTDLPATITGDDGFLCTVCGNHPRTYGWYPVNELGDDVEPIADEWPRPLYRCAGPGDQGADCGLVIDQDTFDPATSTYRVVGRVRRCTVAPTA